MADPKIIAERDGWRILRRGKRLEAEHPASKVCVYIAGIAHGAVLVFDGHSESIAVDAWVASELLADHAARQARPTTQSNPETARLAKELEAAIAEIHQYVDISRGFESWTKLCRVRDGVCAWLAMVPGESK